MMTTATTLLALLPVVTSTGKGSDVMVPMTLPLLGGNTGRTSPYGFHDWEFILKESGLAHYDHALAHFAHRLGAILMIFALVWGGYILYKQYKSLKG
jgi:hypothetical protein